MSSPTISLAICYTLIITFSLFFITGGRIDHAHHYNNPYRALDETLMLEESLHEVLSVVDPAETLIVVTSDHSHVLSFGGLNTPIGNPILGNGITTLFANPSECSG